MLVQTKWISNLGKAAETLHEKSRICAWHEGYRPGRRMDGKKG